MDKEQKFIIKITTIIVIIICIISIVIFFNKNSFTKVGKFVIPEMEKNAISGRPSDVANELMYQEVKVNDNYIVYLCAIPTYKNNKLTIYFTSVETNSGLMKIKVLDSHNNIIGESGLINPNSYVKEIKLNRELLNKEKITIKVMHYEKDTYYSLGNIKLDLLVNKM